MDRTIEDIFAEIAANKNAEYDFSFTSENDMDNIEAMRTFVYDNDLEDYILEDDGTHVFLHHDDYDFTVSIVSEGLGDFFSHGIYMIRTDLL